jgi:hypothetical protein
MNNLNIALALFTTLNHRFLRLDTTSGEASGHAGHAVHD